MDYPANSDKAKEAAKTPKKEIKPLKLGGEVSVKPPSVGSKFKTIFLGGDFRTTAEYVATSVLLPALRNLIVDAISKGTDRLIYGDHAPQRPRTTGYSAYSPRVQYNNPIYRGTSGPLQPPKPRWEASSAKKPFETITVGSKEDADRIIEAMMDVVSQYEVVSVADLFEMIGEEFSYVDNKWGWTNLASISTHQTRDGYAINFPPVEEIQ